MRYQSGQVVARSVREARSKVASKVTEATHAVDFWRSEVETAPDYTPDQERFVVLHLNSRHTVVGWHLVSVGSITSCAAEPREVFRAAIVNNAARIVVLHNHPSGEADPSSADIRVSQKLERAGRLLEIELLDSIIIGTCPDLPPAHISLREKGLLGSSLS